MHEPKFPIPPALVVPVLVGVEAGVTLVATTLPPAGLELEATTTLLEGLAAELSPVEVPVPGTMFPWLSTDAIAAKLVVIPKALLNASA